MNNICETKHDNKQNFTSLNTIYGGLMISSDLLQFICNTKKIAINRLINLFYFEQAIKVRFSFIITTVFIFFFAR